MHHDHGKQEHAGHDKAACKCPHHNMGAVFVVLFGLTFLLGHMEVISAYAMNIAWPVIIIAAGLTKFFGKNCKCCSNRCNCGCGCC